MTQRLAALRFFYTQTIKKAWSVADTPYPKKTRPLPSILSPEEVAHLIDSSQTRFHRMVLMTLYGTGYGAQSWLACKFPISTADAW